MGRTGAELTGGMGDMRGILQPITTRAINTESLSQRDPVPGPVSTLTGPLPGQSQIAMCGLLIHLLMQFSMSYTDCLIDVHRLNIRLPNVIACSLL